MKTAAIVQARMGSSRFWGKVLRELPTGRVVLREVLYRVSQIKGIDTVVLATPDTVENEILGHVAGDECRAGRPVWIARGPEHDVLARYVKAAEAVNADVIMRITADCPLIDPETCGLVLKHRADFDADYASNCFPVRHFPHGWDCEVFTRDVLLRAHRNAEPLHYVVPASDGGLIGRDNEIGSYDRQHVTPWIQRQTDITRVTLKNSNNDRSHLRWTLDTLADYKVIWSVFEQQMRDAA